MMKITIISLGRLKEKFFVCAADEYIKRLSRFCKLSIEEIEPVRLPENPSSSQIESALSGEGNTVLKRIPENAFVTALCIEGKKMSSEAFAKVISTAQNTGKHMVFVIGSSYGLSKSVKQRADLCLSFSDMTFPHRFFRVMLLEQIYRGFQINSGSEYHK